MSYEGYTQYLCKNGHLRTFDALDGGPEACSCGAPFVWRNEVDETNGCEATSEEHHSGKRCPSCGYVELTPIPESLKKCKCHCGNEHFLEEVR